MAEDSINTLDLVIGSKVSFASKFADPDFYEGTVVFVNSDDGGFRIANLKGRRWYGEYTRSTGTYQFFPNNIKDLKVISMPEPESTTNTTKDDQKRTNPREESTTNITKDDQKRTNPGAQKRTNPGDQKRTNPAMASDLVIGSKVSFTWKLTDGDFFHGTVNYFVPESGGFMITDVWHKDFFGDYQRLEGCFSFLLNEIKDFKVISMPVVNGLSAYPHLVVGSVVSFAMKMAGEDLYLGTVYFVNRDDDSFRIYDVSYRDVFGVQHRVEGYYQFFLQNIKNLTVISMPTPHDFADFVRVRN